MKLSQLETLVTHMRVLSKPGSDPNVTFWKKRETSDPVTEKGAITFVDFDLKVQNVCELAWDSKVIVGSKNTLCEVGDFNLPIEVIDFYK